MDKKIIIWALYDDASRSIFNALKNDKDVEVYSLGINEKEHEKNYLKIDLSLNNKNLEKQAEQLAQKYGAPDIVFASPPVALGLRPTPGNNWKILT